MARTIPATYEVPEPDLLTSGRIIRARDMQPVARDQNRLYAVGRAQPVISQGWRGGIVSSNAANYEKHCVWRIPKISERHTQLRCIVRGAMTAGGTSGGARFNSVNAGDTCTLTLPAGGNAFYASDGAGTPHLDAGFVDGPAEAPWPYEEIELYLRGDPFNGAKVANLYAASVGFVPLSSLTSGAAGDFTPNDDDEWAADEPLAADQLAQLRANNVDLETRPRIVANWAAPLRHTNGTINVYYQRNYVRTNRRRPTTLYYHVYMGSLTDDADLWIQHGPGHALADNAFCTHLHVDAGAGPQWVSGTVTLADGIDLGAPHSLMHVDWTCRADGFEARPIYTVSMWAI